MPSTETCPTVAGAVTLEDLDSGRLARAVRTQEAEYLAGLDLEADAVEPLNVTVGLAQPFDLDHGGHSGDSRGGSAGGKESRNDS